MKMVGRRRKRAAGPDKTTHTDVAPFTCTTRFISFELATERVFTFSRGAFGEKAAPPRPGSQVRSKQPDDFLSAASPAGSQRHKIHETPQKKTIDRQ